MDYKAKEPKQDAISKALSSGKSAPVGASKPSSSLSLGLEDLLNIAKASEPEIQAAPEPSVLQYADSLRLQQAFDQLQQYSESKLDDFNVRQGDKKQLKLYWILSKLKLRAVPASVLLGTFEEALTNLAPGERVSEALLADIQTAFNDQIADPLLKTNLLGMVPLPAEAQSSERGSSPITDRKIKSFSFVRITIIVLVLLCSACGVIFYLTEGQPFPWQKSPPFVWDVLSAEKTSDNIILPELTPLPAPGALDTVLYDLKKHQQNQKPSAGNSERLGSATNPTAAPTIDSQSAGQPANQPAGQPAQGSAGQHADQSKPTARENSQQASTEPNHASSPKPSSSQKEVNVGGPFEPGNITDMRNNPHYEAQHDENGSQDNSGRTDTGRIVDGGVALPPQFKEFSESRYYKIRRETSVRSDPSLRSEAYAGLKPGIRVEVIGQEGYWLKIKSRSGRLGFILAEDAGIEADWEVQNQPDSFDSGR